MKSQPNRDYHSDDVIQTPPPLARRLVDHFKPQGRILEPCRGDGNIFQCLPAGSDWCEVKEGRDFYEWTEAVDWIITNPPWSQIRNFLRHSMSVANHVVFLMTVNHIWTRARVRDVKDYGFGIREICLVDMPETFPQSGFQLGAIYVARDWTGDIRLSDITDGQRVHRSIRPRAPVAPSSQAG